MLLVISVIALLLKCRLGLCNQIAEKEQVLVMQDCPSMQSDRDFVKTTSPVPNPHIHPYPTPGHSDPCVGRASPVYQKCSSETTNSHPRNLEHRVAGTCKTTGGSGPWPHFLIESKVTSQASLWEAHFVSGVFSPQSIRQKWERLLCDFTQNYFWKPLLEWMNSSACTSNGGGSIRFNVSLKNFEVSPGWRGSVGWSIIL